MELYFKNKMIENNTTLEDIFLKKEKIQKQQCENYEKECRKYKIHSYTQKVKINTNNKTQHKHN